MTEHANNGDDAFFQHDVHHFETDEGRMAYVDVDPNGSPNDVANGGSNGDRPNDRPVVLCVHGNPTWGFYYRRVIERFADRYRVIAVDHLGCGRSEKPADRGQYTMAAHRDRLVKLIDHLGLSSIALLAHDWGGAIGLSAMAQRIELVDRVALLNTAAFPPPYIPFRISVCRWPIVGPIAVRGFNAFARAAITMAMHRNRLSPSAAAGLIRPYDNWTNRVAINAFVRDIPMRPNHPTHAQLQSLESSLPMFADKPVALIWGMQDWCFRPECLDRLADAWPHAEVTRIADAGHYVIEDAPDETLDAIGDWLAAQATSDAPPVG